jgi:hypothetical protein
MPRERSTRKRINWSAGAPATVLSRRRASTTRKREVVAARLRNLEPPLASTAKSPASEQRNSIAFLGRAAAGWCCGCSRGVYLTFSQSPLLSCAPPPPPRSFSRPLPPFPRTHTTSVHRLHFFWLSSLPLIASPCRRRAAPAARGGRGFRARAFHAAAAHPRAAAAARRETSAERQPQWRCRRRGPPCRGSRRRNLGAPALPLSRGGAPSPGPR